MIRLRPIVLAALLLGLGGCDDVMETVTGLFAGKCPVPKGEGQILPSWFDGPWVMDVQTEDEQYTAVWHITRESGDPVIFEETAASVSTRRPVPVGSAQFIDGKMVIDVRDENRFGPDGNGLYVIERLTGVTVPTLVGCYKFTIASPSEGGEKRIVYGEILEMKPATFGTLYERNNKLNRPEPQSDTEPEKSQ